MARIGIDARLTHYRVGGISTYIRHLITALEKLESDHRYIVFQSRRIRHNMTTALAEQFRTARLFTPPHHPRERWTLSAELLPYRLDVLHSPDFIPPQRGARRHVITVHDLTFLHYPEHKDAEGTRYYSEQIEWAVQHADHILTVSNATRNDLISMLNVPPEKITVQPHGVSFREYPTLRQTQIGERMFHDWLTDQDFPSDYILHVGTLEPRKNIPTLLDAYVQLRARMDNVPVLLLVGQPGWLFEKTMEKIDCLQKSGVPVLVRSDVKDSELSLLYNRARLLVMPSYYEGFGLPALEAMACGTPVVASNVSSLPEIVGEAGLLIDPNDADALAGAMERALKDEQWRSTARQNGLARAAQFSWKESARIALAVYEKVLS